MTTFFEFLEWHFAFCVSQIKSLTLHPVKVGEDETALSRPNRSNSKEQLSEVRPQARPFPMYTRLPPRAGRARKPLREAAGRWRGSDDSGIDAEIRAAGAIAPAAPNINLIKPPLHAGWLVSSTGKGHAGHPVSPSLLAIKWSMAQLNLDITRFSQVWVDLGNPRVEQVKETVPITAAPASAWQPV